MINKTVSTSAIQEPILIPRKTLFGNPEITNPKLSPDGKYIIEVTECGVAVLDIILAYLWLNRTLRFKPSYQAAPILTCSGSVCSRLRATTFVLPSKQLFLIVHFLTE